MASGSLTVAALRHRPREAALVVVLAAVVTGAAVIGPLYARAVEQSIVRTVLTDAGPAQRGVTVTAIGRRPPPPEELAQLAASAVRRTAPARTGPAPAPLFAAPIGGADVSLIASAATSPGSRGMTRLTSRDRMCEHLQVGQGRCPSGAGEVLVSRRDSDALGLRPGSQVRLDDQGRRLTATVAGVYEPYDAAADYWFERGAAVAAPAGRNAGLAVFDTMFTPWQTLAGRQWSELRSHADVALLPARVDVDTAADARETTREIEKLVRGQGASSTTELPALLSSTDGQRRQARTIVPLLAVQLALLGVVVLGFVAAAATEQRRPEVALARLRGQGRRGATGLLVGELGTLVLIGTTLGALAGWAAARLAATRWLAPGLSLELRWPVGVALVAAGAAGLLAVLVAATPTVQQPVVSLLRRVPPRRSALTVGLIEGGLVAATGAGVVTLLAGDNGGPVALLAPGLLAVAGGLLLAQVVVPVATQLSRLSMRRGRLPSALAGTHVARRPALRRLIAIVTVSCALLVFAVDTWTVGQRNRTLRAAVDAGAPVVLTIDAKDARALREAVLDVDPRAEFATPVVSTRSLTEAGPRTTAVEPDAFARIARWGSTTDRPDALQLAALTPERADPLSLSGTQVKVTADWLATGVADGPDLPVPVLEPFHLLLHATDSSGDPVDLDLGRLRAGNGTYQARMPCADRCLLHRIEITRTFGDFATADIRLTIRSMRAGPAGRLGEVDLGPAEKGTWQPVPDRASGFIDFAVIPGPPLQLTGTSFAGAIVAQRGDVPVAPPALVAGDVPEAPADLNREQPQVLAPDLGNSEQGYVDAGTIAQVPRTGARGVLIALDAVDDVAGPPGPLTSYTVWLDRDDAIRERALVRALAERGLVVVGRDTAQAHEVALASEGPTLALRLALLAGIVALVLAAAVLVVGVATSGATRARDLAALRVVGVPVAVVRKAAVREHLVVSVLGVLAGAGLGLAAAQAALPRIPLFAHAHPALPVLRHPAWEAVALTTLVCLVLLALVSVVVGRALAAAATPERLREGRS